LAPVRHAASSAACFYLTSDEILLEIIIRRYEHRSTMMTSNRPIEEWGKLLSDVPAANTTPAL